MKEKYQVGVFGLGKFGFYFGNTLIHLGHEVLGVDNDPERVKNAQQIFTQVLQADATNKEALEQIGANDLTHALISVGDSIAASAMISMYLKELGVQNVWVKAINKDHGKLLYKIGVDEVIIPEHMAAKQIATRIAMPGFIEHLPFDKTMGVKEFTVNTWAGKNLRELNLTNLYNIQLIAIKNADQPHYKFIPKADEILRTGDKIVAIGKIDQFSTISP
jgi:trk system potassium uptake protein TrkA